MQTATEASSVSSKQAVSPNSIRSSWYKNWCKSASSNHRKAATSSSIGFQLLARACLLPRQINRFCTHTITITITTSTSTSTSTTITNTNIATTATDHYHRQSFLSLSRPPQPTTTFTNARAAEEPINPIDNIISRCRALRNRLQTPRIQATQANRYRTDAVHSQDLL
jgi:hypothetical protein